MKKLLLAFVVLSMMLGAPSGAQTTELLVHDGDTFTFVIKTLDVSNSQDTSSSGLTISEESGTGSITLNEGDTFTVKIVSATPVKDSGEVYLLTEYTAHGVTIQQHDYIDFGGFIVYPDWDGYKSDLTSSGLTSSTSDTDYSNSYKITIIDTASEFGYIQDSTYSYSYGDTSSTSSNHNEIRYSKADGVVNYISFTGSSTDVSSGTTTKDNGKIQIVRQGYNIPNTGPALPLPAYQFLWIIPAMIAIGVIRRRIYN